LCALPRGCPPSEFPFFVCTLDVIAQSSSLKLLSLPPQILQRGHRIPVPLPGHLPWSSTAHIQHCVNPADRIANRHPGLTAPFPRLSRVAKCGKPRQHRYIHPRPAVPSLRHVCLANLNNSPRQQALWGTQTVLFPTASDWPGLPTTCTQGSGGNRQAPPISEDAQQPLRLI
jgi:hypothetical protein